MKILSSIIMCCAAICIGNVSAMGEMYEMNAATAADMRLLSVSAGDTGSLVYVGYNPGGPGDWVFGTETEFGAGEANMTYAVGFTGDVRDSDQSGFAQVTIGLSSPGLSGTYDGFLLPIANDNDDTWQYRAYVTTAGGTTYSDWSAGLVPGKQTELLVSTFGLDYGTVTGIGFVTQWDRSLNNGRTGDFYNTSVVPVPGAVLLGMFGLSIVGVKLRKYA